MGGCADRWPFMSCFPFLAPARLSQCPSWNAVAGREDGGARDPGPLGGGIDRISEPQRRSHSTLDDKPLCVYAPVSNRPWPRGSAHSTGLGRRSHPTSCEQERGDQHDDWVAAPILSLPFCYRPSMAHLLERYRRAQPKFWSLAVVVVSMLRLKDRLNEGACHTDSFTR